MPGYRQDKSGSPGRAGFLFLLWGIWVAHLGAEDFFKLRDRIRETAWKRISIFYIMPNLTINNLGYSSNILAYDATTKPDWTADLGVNVKVSTIFGKRFIFQVTDNPFYSFYLKNKQWERFNNKFNADIYTYLGRFNLHYTFSRSDLQDRPNSEFGEVVRHFEWNHEFSVDYGSYEHFYFNLYFKQRNFRYLDLEYLGDPENNLKYMLDSQESWSGIGINKKIFTRTIIALKYDYFINTFLYAKQRDSIGSRISLAVFFPEIGLISGNFQLGAMVVQPDNPDYSSYLKPFGSGSVSLRFLHRFKFTTKYLVNHFFSFLREATYFDEESYTFNLDYYLLNRFKVGCLYGSGRLVFNSLLQNTDYDRTDRITRTGITVGFKISKEFMFGLEYTRFRASSTDVQYKRSYNFIGGYISHDF